MTIRAAIVIAIGLAGSAVGAPKVAKTKPTDAQAKKAVADWIAAMQFGTAPSKLAAATALTALPFHAAAYDDEGVKCPDASAGTPDAVAKTLACLQTAIAPQGKPKVWTHKSTRNLGGPIAADGKAIDELRKTAAIVELDEGCDGSENEVVFAVTKDAKRGALVAGVFAQTVTCTE